MMPDADARPDIAILKDRFFEKPIQKECCLFIDHRYKSSFILSMLMTKLANLLFFASVPESLQPTFAPVKKIY